MDTLVQNNVNKDFQVVENSFADMLQGKNEAMALKNIEKVLYMKFHKTFALKLTNPAPNKTLFVMSIVPDESTIQNMVVAILQERNDLALKAIWDQCNNWTIEIDKRIFDPRIIQLTPQELTALLLHEIGHNVYSNSIPQRVSRVLKYEYARASGVVKTIIQQSVFKDVLTIPILDSCGFNLPSGDALKAEVKADGFVARMGYREPLVTALGKFTRLSNIDKSDPDKRMGALAQYSLTTVDQFKRRQDKLVQKSLGTLVLNCPSETVKTYTDKVYGRIFNGDNPLKGIMTESVKLNKQHEIVDRIVEENYYKEFFIFGSKKMKRIDPADLDYIDIQIANIKNNDDKMLIISYIYSKLETVNFYLDIIQSPKYSKKYSIPHSERELIRMRDRLEMQKNKAVAFKIPEVKYGIYINYPQGFEG